MNLKKILADVLAFCIVGGTLPSVNWSADNSVKAASAVDNEDSTATEVKYGDVNDDGYINLADSSAIIANLGNRDCFPFNETNYLNADVYGCGDGVTGLDSLAIESVLLGKNDLSVLDPRLITKLADLPRLPADSSNVSDNPDFYFDFGEYTANPGDTILIEPKIIINTKDDVKPAINSMDIYMNIPDVFKVGHFNDKCYAFPDRNLYLYFRGNPDKGRFLLYPIDEDTCESLVPESGAHLFSIELKIPNDAKLGSYKIGFEEDTSLFKCVYNSDRWTWNCLGG